MKSNYKIPKYNSYNIYMISDCDIAKFHYNYIAVLIVWIILHKYII